MQNTCEGSKHFDFWAGRAKYLSWFLWGRGESMIVAERLSHLQYRLTCMSQPPFGLPCSNSPKPPSTPIWWGISFTLSVDHTTKYSHDFFAFSSWSFKWGGACPSALRGIQSLHPSGLQEQWNTSDCLKLHCDKFIKRCCKGELLCDDKTFPSYLMLRLLNWERTYSTLHLLALERVLSEESFPEFRGPFSGDAHVYW